MDPVYIAGFCVAGSILLGLAIWLFISLSRKRARARRESMRNAAFLSIKGISKECPPRPDDLPVMEKKLQDIVLQPPRAHTSDSEDVIDYHRRSGTFTKPFSFALSANHPSRCSAGPRESLFSISTHSRFSVHSHASSVDSTPTTGTARKVRQIFEPVLPDELLIRADEHLTLVQSFDDGWCLVGRENTSFVENAKSLFIPNTVVSDAIELGVIPAWCFIKCAPSLHTERPIRNTSLGITVQLNASDTISRDNIISWSNF